MFQTTILTQVPDLVDGGIDEALDVIHALGASSITLNVVTPARMHLRSLGNVTPRILRSRGGYFYHVDGAFYDETHAKPIVATWVQKRHPLEKVVDGCRKRNIGVRFRVSVLEIGRMADKYPDCAGKSAIGDIAPETLCPSHPDVRALLRGTLRELVERFSPDAIELTDLRYHSGALGFGGLAMGFDPGAGFLELLSICFSESSRQAASERDIDTDAALRWAQVQLDRVLESGKPLLDSLAELIEDEEIPRSYLLCQRDTLDSFLVGLIRNAGVDVYLVLPGDDEDGMLPSMVSIREAAGLVIETDVESPDEVAATVAEARRRFGDGANLTLDFDAAGYLGGDAQHLVSAVKAAVDQDAAAVSLSEWGLMPPGRLDPLKQAIRYASRAST
jgi:hypothetical protein